MNSAWLISVREKHYSLVWYILTLVVLSYHLTFKELPHCLHILESLAYSLKSFVIPANLYGLFSLVFGVFGVFLS